MPNNKEPKFTPTTGYVSEGEFFVCNCGIPLAKNLGHGRYEIMKRQNGQVAKITTQTINGMMKVKCDTCGRGFNYINIQESIGITDSVEIKKDL